MDDGTMITSFLLKRLEAAGYLTPDLLLKTMQKILYMRGINCE